MHENFYARNFYARKFLCTKIFMHEIFMHENFYARKFLCTVKVNVIQINGVFSTFLLQTVLSQSGGYYLIGTEVEPDIVLPVNIFRY
jgi:hypothetical protein